VLPSEIDARDGLAYSLWVPGGDPPPLGGIVILHGAGSCKENHHDFARVVLAAGFAAVTFDQRGHGESDGPMDARAIDDVVGMASLLRSATEEPELPIILRGSSMGGYFAIVAAAGAGAHAVVAICPAPPESVVRGLRAGKFGFAADVEAVSKLLTANDLFAAMRELKAPVLLMHAEGDEQVPVEHSRELIARARLPASRLIAPPGGHHRSVQHDDELQAASVAFIKRALRRATG
jgi:alpha-beta hydrolase superfamily lysophospholipase